MACVLVCTLPFFSVFTSLSLLLYPSPLSSPPSLLPPSLPPPSLPPSPLSPQLAMCAHPMREISNPGASGSLFYLSADDAFIIKTVQKKEAHFLQKLLPGYYLVRETPTLTPPPSTLPHPAPYTHSTLVALSKQCLCISVVSVLGYKVVGESLCSFLHPAPYTKPQPPPPPPHSTLRAVSLKFCRTSVLGYKVTEFAALHV